MGYLLLQTFFLMLAAFFSRRPARVSRQVGRFRKRSRGGGGTRGATRWPGRSARRCAERGALPAPHDRSRRWCAFCQRPRSERHALRAGADAARRCIGGGATRAGGSCCRRGGRHGSSAGGRRARTIAERRPAASGGCNCTRHRAAASSGSSARRPASSRGRGQDRVGGGIAPTATGRNGARRGARPGAGPHAHPGIDGGLARRLGELGVRRYEQIASWSAKDVERVSSVLGVTGRVQKENWIEQAQILARGAETAYVRHDAATAAAPRAQGTGQPGVAAAAVPPAAPKAAPTPGPRPQPPGAVGPAGGPRGRPAAPAPNGPGPAAKAGAAEAAVAAPGPVTPAAAAQPAKPVPGPATPPTITPAAAAPAVPKGRGALRRPQRPPSLQQDRHHRTGAHLRRLRQRARDSEHDPGAVGDGDRGAAGSAATGSGPPAPPQRRARCPPRRSHARPKGSSGGLRQLRSPQTPGARPSAARGAPRPSAPHRCAARNRTACGGGERAARRRRR